MTGKEPRAALTVFIIMKGKFLVLFVQENQQNSDVVALTRVQMYSGFIISIV